MYLLTIAWLLTVLALLFIKFSLSGCPLVKVLPGKAFLNVWEGEENMQGKGHHLRRRVYLTVTDLPPSSQYS